MYEPGMGDAYSLEDLSGIDTTNVDAVAQTLAGLSQQDQVIIVTTQIVYGRAAPGDLTILSIKYRIYVHGDLTNLSLRFLSLLKNTFYNSPAIAI